MCTREQEDKKYNKTSQTISKTRSNVSNHKKGCGVAEHVPSASTALSSIPRTAKKKKKGKINHFKNQN
jgi:hypothetical protein